MNSNNKNDTILMIWICKSKSLKYEQDHEICLEAVKKDGSVLEYMKSYINNIKK